jgi:hypothetical protein
LQTQQILPKIIRTVPVFFLYFFTYRILKNHTIILPQSRRRAVFFGFF